MIKYIFIDVITHNIENSILHFFLFLLIKCEIINLMIEKLI